MDLVGVAILTLIVPLFRLSLCWLHRGASSGTGGHVRLFYGQKLLDGLKLLDGQPLSRRLESGNRRP